MMAHTIFETISSLLDVPMRAIPLSSCRITRPYLLERAGIRAEGTAVMLLLPYLMHEDVYAPDRNLSLYAVPRDYHGYLQDLKDLLLPPLRGIDPAYRFALFADHSPIAEVDAAARAGLGVRGENGLLLAPQYGSFVFIAEMITDADYTTVTGEEAPDFPDAPPACERCGACRAACPAQNGGMCLSALTQKKGNLTMAEAEALRAHELVWGCDICQLVCPYNRDVLAGKADTTIPYFRVHRTHALTAEQAACMNERDFQARAYAWRGREVILRNLMFKEETR